MIQAQKDLNTFAEGEVRLPEDFTTNIPPDGAVWLLKSGVTTYLSTAYGIGWSEKLQRVILPVEVDGSLVCVQGRAIHEGQKPKYYNKKRAGKDLMWFWSKPELMLENVRPRTCIITEDILSTIRTGRLLPSFSTLGTKLNPKLAVRANQRGYDTFLIWYDGDEAGMQGSIQVKKDLELMGFNTKIIKTELDPKEYNNDEIKHILLQED